MLLMLAGFASIASVTTGNQVMGGNDSSCLNKAAQRVAVEMVGEESLA